MWHERKIWKEHLYTKTNACIIKMILDSFFFVVAFLMPIDDRLTWINV